ncbi:hypothetical protein OS493_017365 [Desmophyllum pertusum]|uniref:Neurotransmitter-gated ion-channel ligand-binding domain-containing protein n=1 Tax=Desmophyllum pertusum TaxID=174260 RepID=A0A9X0A1D2_9CNID|nr:hypothetical protein OS493_017365 [Desmophyllum pertusum]
MTKLHIAMLAAFYLASLANCYNIRRRSYQNTTKVLNSLTATGEYDKRIRPYHEGPPLNISVYITVVSFWAIKEINMEYTLDIFFKQAWNDPRLQHELQKPILLSGSEKGNFWLPDTFLFKCKDGKIRRTCVLEILSYSYDINDMDYHWDDEKAVIILDDEMSEFELADAQSERKLVKYVIGTYTHLVAKNSVPKVSYIKAIDSYLIVSFIFVFGVLLEYVAVLMHSERQRMKARKKSLKSKDYSLAEMEIEAFNATNTSVLPRSRSSHSLPPRSPSAHSLPARPPSSYSLPPKSVLRTSYTRQSVPGPAIQHSPYTTNPPRTTIIKCIPSFCLALGSNSEVDIFDRIARIIFPLSFFMFNIGYYFRYSGL